MKFEVHPPQGPALKAGQLYRDTAGNLRLITKHEDGGLRAVMFNGQPMVFDTPMRLYDTGKWTFLGTLDVTFP